VLQARLRKKHGDNTRKEDPVECPSPANGSNRGSQADKAVKVEQIGTNQTPHRARDVSERWGLLRRKQESNGSSNKRRNEQRNRDPYARDGSG
jgi:hypothetical protein